ncbi:MAG TPA: ABC transporter permease [Thermoanaerobaculia bacterium]|nr:ABC transporter permease [Thermoanaerobaculia bacterium]
MTRELVTSALAAGWRLLRHDRLFSVVIVATFALGIAANSLVFGVLYAVLLQPLPYPQADRLTVLWGMHRDTPGETSAVSERGFVDWRQRSRSFSALAAYRFDGIAVTDTGDPEEVLAAEVSPELFDLLGVAPVLGGGLRPEDARAGAPCAVVVSHGFWRARLGGDAEAVGRSLRLEGRACAVLGVMPSWLEFPSAEVQLWLPLQISPASPDTRARNLLVIARLRDGVSLAGARRELAGLAAALARETPAVYDGWQVALFSLRDQLVGNARLLLLVLQVAVAAILLICCVNVSHLLMARATLRTAEFSIRLAIGADRRHLVGHLIGESVVLAILGGVTGLALAHTGLVFLVRYGPQDLWQLKGVELDARLVAFTLGVALLAGLVAALLPTLQLFHGDLFGRLRAGMSRPAAGLRRSPLRQALMVTEIALSLVLVVAAGLMLRSLVRLQRVEPGWQPEGLLAVQIYLPEHKHREPAEKNAFFDRLLEGLETAPGAVAAAGTTALPGTQVGIDFDLPVISAGGRPGDGTAALRAVTPAFFRTMGIPLVAGHEFERGARSGTMVVNQRFVRRFLPAGRSPVGQTVVIPFRGRSEHQIIGVVRDIRHDGLEQEPQPEFYLPFAHTPFRGLGVVVRTRVPNPAGFAPTFKAQLLAIDPEQSVSFIQPMDQVVGQAYRRRGFVLAMLGAFALLALLLTVVGVYGVMSFLVDQQVPEIGLRIALGAGRSDIMQEVVGQVAKVAAAGLLLGITGALVASRFLSALLYGVSPRDPLVFAAATAVLAVITLAGAAGPARRALSVDPLIALRGSNAP